MTIRMTGYRSLTRVTTMVDHTKATNNMLVGWFMYNQIPWNLFTLQPNTMEPIHSTCCISLLAFCANNDIAEGRNKLYFHSSNPQHARQLRELFLGNFYCKDIRYSFFLTIVSLNVFYILQTSNAANRLIAQSASDGFGQQRGNVQDSNFGW